MSRVKKKASRVKRLASASISTNYSRWKDNADVRVLRLRVRDLNTLGYRCSDVGPFHLRHSFD